MRLFRGTFSWNFSGRIFFYNQAELMYEKGIQISYIMSDVFPGVNFMSHVKPLSSDTRPARDASNESVA
jgi:hypothetical protein